MMNFARIFITLLIYEDMHLFSSLFINRYQGSVYGVSIIRFRAVIEWEIICLSIFLVPPPPPTVPVHLLPFFFPFASCSSY